MRCIPPLFEYRAFSIFTLSFSPLGYSINGGSFQDFGKLQTFPLAEGETEALTLMAADLLPDF